MNPIVVTMLPVLGVVVGAVLQHWLSRSAENRKQLHVLRRDAYVDYLRAATKVARARDQSEQWEAKTQLTDAKPRIAVCGESYLLAAPRSRTPDVCATGGDSGRSLLLSAELRG